ncbi:MAG: hypothetical protein GY801_21565 [bacterium]|nr:hypothetical protein [bacterium]
MKLNSRERVAKALNHKTPDRAPFDCTFTIDVYNELIQFPELDSTPKTDCTLFSTVKVDVEQIEATIRIDNDDYGTQNGLLISKRTFVKEIKPVIAGYYATVNAEFHKHNPQGKLMKHSCGAVSTLIEDFIDMGIDVLDPVQVAAKGMQPERLKQVYGERICFHGGIDTQNVLPFGSVAEVQADVRKTMKILGAAGGCIVSPVHHVEGDVPPQNLVAMRDAVVN